MNSGLFLLLTLVGFVISLSQAKTPGAILYYAMAFTIISAILFLFSILKK